MDATVKNDAWYLNIVFFTAPLLNLFSSLIIAFYAPSMPAIASYLHISPESVKNTVTVTMIGFAFGSLFFGAFMDFYGRKKILVPALLFFMVISALGAQVQSVGQLMMIRFFQGFMTASCSIGSRAIIVDYFQGQRFNVAILYTTVAYGFGLMIAPFLGGYIQYYLGWQANFYAYAAMAGLIELLIFFLIKESLQVKNSGSLMQTFKHYGRVLTHQKLLVGIMILGLVQIEQLIFPTIGVFLIQDNLHFSSVMYGYMALATGCSYLLGTLINRAVLSRYSFEHLIGIGFGVMIFAVSLQLLLALQVGLTWWALVLPILIFNIGLGFIFGNIIAFCLRIFPENAGISLAAQTCYLMLLSAVGIFAISDFSITTLLPVPLIYGVIVCIQFLLFHFLIRERAKEFA